MSLFYAYNICLLLICLMHICLQHWIASAMDQWADEDEEEEEEKATTSK